jgi:monoamine oxidase
VDARILDWTKEPTVLGSYSYPSPGSSGLRGDLAAVEGRLHFAGEATHTGGHFATVHGALETGERAVEEIIDRL